MRRLFGGISLYMTAGGDRPVIQAGAKQEQRRKRAARCCKGESGRLPGAVPYLEYFL